jgi:hypothetical protein
MQRDFYSCLLFRPFPELTDIGKFTERLCKDLTISNYEFHDSTNAPNNMYYRGSALGLDVIIYYAEATTIELPEYKYIIFLHTNSAVWSSNESFLDGLADSMAKYLASKGYDIIRLDTCRDGSSQKWYRYVVYPERHHTDIEHWIVAEPFEPIAGGGSGP